MFFGIMQGRLSSTKKNILQFLPRNWEIEFDKAKKAKLDYIELFTTKLNDKSPIWNKNQSLLKKKIYETNLKKIILCDNFVFKKSLLSVEYSFFFNSLVRQLSNYKDSTLVVPIENVFFKKGNYNKLLNKILYFIKISKAKEVMLSFEVQTSYENVLKLKKDLKNKYFQITFDVGNIFIIDNNNKSLMTYLNKTKNFINHIHIKDRDKEGSNVVLGTGIIDFKKFFKTIKKIGYNQTFTFETNRGKNFFLTAKKNLSFVKRKL
jgi:sugar phosphate isomerase/epimerase